MDTTKEYILMCEKAPEVQELWDIRKGDFVFGGKMPVYVIYKNQESKLDYIWLPTQSQLQGMLWNEEREGIEKSTDSEVQGFYWDLMKEVFECLKWYDDECYDYNHFTSMEQLWLAFVMKEKFNKTWNGKEWEILK